MNVRAKIGLTFGHAPEGRVKEVETDYDYVEMTYEDLWAPDRAMILASWKDGYWWTPDGVAWTDIAIGFTLEATQ